MENISSLLCYFFKSRFTKAAYFIEYNNKQHCDEKEKKLQEALYMKQEIDKLHEFDECD